MVNWRFSPEWSALLLFVDIAIFISYIIFLARTVFAWTEQKTKYRYAFIPILIILTPLFVIFISPSMGRNKSYYEETIEVKTYAKAPCKCHLYVEVYLIRGSLTPGETDIDALYLTDSLNFRLYEGIYHEGDGLTETICKGDSVWIEKQTNSFKAAEKKVYGLKNLRASHIFE